MENKKEERKKRIKYVFVKKIYNKKRKMFYVTTKCEKTKGIQKKKTY